jgi:allose kinase
MVRGFDNIPLKPELEKRIGLPVIMEKDVNILLLYELHQKRLSQCGITAGFFLGTGLGNSISIGGKVYSGSSGSACELGHIPVPGLLAECKCGKKGCIELKACGRILEELATNKFRCSIREIFSLHGSSQEIQELVRYFAYAIATEIGILDPECVIVGGGLVEMEGFPKSELIRQIKENIRAPYPRQSLNIEFASGDLVAGVVGAVIHAQNTLGSA